MVDKLLSNNPTPFDIQKVISECGIALNYQIDKNPVIFGKKEIKDDIHHKLRALHLDQDDPKLAEKYGNLNRFYNATKHAKSVQNRANESTLSGPLGREIAIDFFETVKRIFAWYYEKYADDLPRWDELTRIEYSRYGIDYAFSCDKRWS
ncbi:MAG TPA: hypothetical protein VMX75_03725 [Spirochaetia bacterium]|nr:hypothetical protein [Spirochaetia bacterium]